VELDDENTVIYNEVEETDIYLEDGNLIVHSTKKLTLILSGTFHGSVHIYKPDGKLKLVLDGVDITSESGPAINLQTEKRCFVVLNHNTVNHLEDGTDHPLMLIGTETKAALFSEEQLIISGTGELHINARYKHGIASDDYLRILSGKLFIYSTTSDGLHAKDYLIIDGGIIDIEAKEDGIEVTKGYVYINGGITSINAGGDGIKTSYEGTNELIDPFIYLNNGMIEINALFEGLKSTSDITLNHGAMIVETVDDAVSAVGSIYIVDGLYYFHSTDKQSLDGDITVTIEGGMLVLYSGGDTAVIESDEGDILFQGGIIVAAGPTNFSIGPSQQGYVNCGPVAVLETLNLRDESTIRSIGFLTAYNTVVVSTPELISGASIDLYSGGAQTGNNFFGLYTSGTYQGGSRIKSLQVN